MSGELVKETRLLSHARAPWRGLALWLLAIPATLVGLWFLTVISMITSFIGVLLFPSATRLLRTRLDAYRERINKWTDARIERPYLPEPEEEPGLTGLFKRFIALVSDPATWRDYLWVLTDPFVSLLTAALPAMLILYGIWGYLLAAFAGDVIGDYGGNDWYTYIHVTEGYGSDPGRVLSTVVVATACIALGYAIGPKMLDVYGHWGRALLGPTKKSQLALRVQHLTETRSEAVDASAAELRRIERDLHDGAQARLVAMGMTLGAIEHLLDKDPEKARLLLAETRASSAKALHELRDLVRGIHPPVLADRGLGDAVKALALDHPMRVEVVADLPGRAEPPVESAAYFAVSEILTNAAKHAGASRVWIDMRYENGMLRITITDDGRGGATLDGGTGLRGIERRIGTFDGVLALSSPVGGPTIVTLELPCALSSPKTSPF
ncbi:Histidine kinase-, DNA gyrase B-, and HSP90-like ATPase [Actinomadura meyerae]|uniref:histidine kinase n=1 Tax=Actinomadura meyerae TaxID=240840 RepID=A0A239M2S9_9ACTN|nr:sensor histidine kinase [Actinomadura meyerae]SNT36428.1 Histidine kinase-, DNA gyrase B-, and HSP90-like ATPase [Actinomadura meyerae]